MAPRKKRRLPQALQLRNTNVVVREESSLMDFVIVVSIICIALPWLVWFLG